VVPADLCDVGDPQIRLYMQRSAPQLAKADKRGLLRHNLSSRLNARTVGLHNRKSSSFNLSRSTPLILSLSGRHRPFSSQMSPVQGPRLLPEPNRAGKLTRTPLTFTPSTAQPGRSQSHRREAFSRLARSQRTEGTSKAEPASS
jgi:hypothetical protein